MTFIAIRAVGRGGRTMAPEMAQQIAFLTAGDGVAPLTTREHEVLAKGKSLTEIAQVEHRVPLWPDKSCSPGNSYSSRDCHAEVSRNVGCKTLSPPMASKTLTVPCD